MGKPVEIKRIIDAIPGTGGIISQIAKKTGYEWHAVKNAVNKFPTVAQAYQDECERVSDMAQGVLMKSIQEGNTQDAKWWLARKRRQDFGDNIDVTSGGKKIDFSRLSDDQLERLIRGDDPGTIITD